ncbi:MAG: GMC oxidoreductase [Nitrospiraceae bacterium]
MRQKVGRVPCALVEPVPDAESRVTLSEEQDELGTAQVRVQWRLDALAQRTLDLYPVRFCGGTGAGRRGKGAALGPKLEERIGRARSTLRRISTKWVLPGCMIRRRAGVVVDRYGLVHGMRNLYVAGGSVFPTAGAGPPSLTVVALALRMADRLIDELKPGGRLR